MLLVLKRVPIRDGSFEHPEHVKTDWLENIYNFTLNNFVYLNLCSTFKPVHEILNIWYYGIVSDEPLLIAYMQRDFRQTCTCDQSPHALCYSHFRSRGLDEGQGQTFGQE